ncbi:hypothetical protein ABT160_11985 [Streptomyces sp. NPDC001941]|uniref:CAP domain-containing protein n=1 Tax=Streptomyces sp. NPDC001941 TaxID=3154659 RepID=UPI003333BDA7
MNHMAKAAAAAAIAALLGPLPAAAATAAPRTDAPYTATGRAAAPHPGGKAVTPPAYYPDVDAIVCEINEERERLALAPLLVSDEASEVGRAHAQDMAIAGRLGGTGSDGRDQRARLADAGIFSAYIREFLFQGFHHDGYFADRATDPVEGGAFYKALTSKDAFAMGLGYDQEYWDVNVLGPHRKLVARPADCGTGTAAS